MSAASGPATPAVERVAAARMQEGCKRYGMNSGAVMALDHVTVCFDAGTFSAIMGPSGSGKSTLLHCMSGLDSLTSGQAHVGTRDLSSLNDRELTELRRSHVGFVFQGFNLLPNLTARENIELPAGLAGRRPDPEWLGHLTDLLGITARLDHRPSQLSGGQQQRVAVARALVNRPTVVFADEPTGNLDTRTGATLLELLARIVDEEHQSVVMVTHDPGAASHADRVVFLVDGRIEGDLTDPTAEVVAHRMAELEG
ncbi:MAG TPA: ABC transporter ATP-binding protein [Acidimicrobiales bacterium]|nr:ABC transporter ATP-binding protein [Acidimicrobiales bacterium]